MLWYGLGEDTLSSEGVSERTGPVASLSGSGAAGPEFFWEVNNMPPVTANTGDVFQLRFEGQLEGQQVVNVMHFSALADDADVITHLVLVAIGCFLNNIIPATTVSYSLQRVVARLVAPTLGPDHVIVPQGQLQGTQTTNQLPSFVAGVISIHTVRPGRSGRGRMYIAGLTDNDVVGSILDPNQGFWGALVAFITCILTNFSVPDNPQPGQWAFGVMSRKLGGAKPPFSAAGFAAVTEMTPVAQVGTMRSRKVGHGS